LNSPASHHADENREIRVAMCMLCRCAEDQESVPREHVLRLLSLLEHPDALHPEQALRLGRQLIATVRAEARLQCEAVDGPAVTVGQTRWRSVP
jgi:hypothetical protein